MSFRSQVLSLSSSKQEELPIDCISLVAGLPQDNSSGSDLKLST
jgi:hypothetical protein